VLDKKFLLLSFLGNGYYKTTNSGHQKYIFRNLSKIEQTMRTSKGQFVKTSKGTKTPKMLEVEQLIGCTIEEDYQKYYLDEDWGQKKLTKRWGLSSRSSIFGPLPKGRQSWVDILGLKKKPDIRKKTGSRGEEWCAQILSQLYDGYTFIKIRLDKFKNPETNRALELDFYCKELNLAVEYNGRQHYEYTKFFHQTLNDFEKQKIRDLIKEGYCDIFNINLIEIPNLQSYEEIEKYIVDCLESRKIPYNINCVKSNSSSKTCFKCGDEKPSEEFHANKSSKDGRRDICKICRNNAHINELPVEKEIIKTCNQCGEEKSLEDFPTDKRNKDNRGGTCYTCFNEKRRVHRTKTCSKCIEEKSLEDFHVNKSSKDGRRGTCKLCQNASDINELSTESTNPKNFKFNAICLELTKINSKFNEISNAINSLVFGDMDMSSQIHNIVIELQNKTKELEEEYQNILMGGLNFF
jgi:hypothetical protein